MNMMEHISKELHKQARRHYPTRNVVLKGINDLYQADLVEMIEYSKSNKGYKYILTMINCFSKFAFAIPLKTKKAEEVEEALKPILAKHKMKNLQTDDGKEWYNSKVKKLLSMYKINHYSTFSEKKASIIERFNRTLKSKMWRKFTAQGSYKWINIIDDLVKCYNNTVHRTIGFKPKDVSHKNEGEVMQNIIRNRQKLKTSFKQKFEVGDKVRISKYKKVFAKGYLPNWTNEVFTVFKVKHTEPITYMLKDEKGELLKGSFYTEELSKTKYDDIYLVQKVLRKRGDKLLVRWRGYDKSHDSWINKKDLIK